MKRTAMPPAAYVTGGENAMLEQLTPVVLDRLQSIVLDPVDHVRLVDVHLVQFILLGRPGVYAHHITLLH